MSKKLFPLVGHNTENRYIDNRKDCFECEDKPRKITRFIDKYKDQPATVLLNVHIKKVSCGLNHTVS